MSVPTNRQYGVTAAHGDGNGSARGPGWRARLAWAIGGPRTTANDVRPPAPSVQSRELAQAIARDELRLVYQPKLHLRRRRISSVEALVRWEHPERGMVLPSDFIPAAEQTDDILAITKWVLGRAIRDQRGLAARGHDMPIFINIAATLLADDDFVTDACSDIIGAAASIGMEITETSVIRDPTAAITNLQRVAALGIPIAIDDYGAGLSSLAYLKQLPACELKIDKLFITELTSSHRDPLIVRSTIDLAHAMEMEVVAEGIEDETALALLTVMGCDMAQGYHISRPLKLADLFGFLDNHRDGWRTDTDGGSLSRLTSTLRRA